jgi:hypothetical protein
LTVRDHGTRARYVWGPDVNDQPGSGCRCAGPEGCVAANAAAEAHRKRMIAYGRWQPFVDAGPVREHVRALGAAGIGHRRAAKLAGVPSSVVCRLLYGGPGARPPARRLRPEAASKILAVSPSPTLLGNCALVGGTGVCRRLQALIAGGRSQASLAARLGMLGSNFGALLHDRDQVTAGTARAVRALYDELWDVPPDESTPWARGSVTRARAYAASRGWPPPAAWDDDLIDDPDAPQPEGWKRPKRMSASDLLEDAAELLAAGYTRELAAERLGLTRDALARAIARAKAAA